MQDGEDGSRVVAQGCVGGEGFAHEVEGAHDGRRRGVALAHGAVVDPLAFASRGEEPGVAQDGEVARDGGGGEPDEFDQLADAQVVGEPLVGGVEARGEEPDAGRVGEGFAEGDEVMHGVIISSFREMSN